MFWLGALLSTVGGQTGLNLSVALAEAGVLDKYNVELIGAKIDSIKKAEDRLLFKDAMRGIGLETPQSQQGEVFGLRFEHDVEMNVPQLLHEFRERPRIDVVGVLAQPGRFQHGVFAAFHFLAIQAR